MSRINICGDAEVAIDMAAGRHMRRLLDKSKKNNRKLIYGPESISGVAWAHVRVVSATSIPRVERILVIPSPPAVRGPSNRAQ